MKMLSHYWNKAVEFVWASAVFLLFGSSIVGGPALLVYQIYTYLKSGIWVPYSLLDGLRYWGEDAEKWVLAPSDWTGLHAVIGKIPLSLAIVVLGFIVSAVLFSGLESFRLERKLKE